MIKPLGQLLIEAKAITPQTLEKALAFQREGCGGGRRKKLGECLIAKYGASEETVYKALALQFGMPFVADIEGIVDRGILSGLSYETFSNTQCLPVEKDDEVLKTVVSCSKDRHY